MELTLTDTLMIIGYALLVTSPIVLVSLFALRGWEKDFLKN